MVSLNDSHHDVAVDEALDGLGRSFERFEGDVVLVGSRNSCGFPMVETEQPAKPFTALNGAL